MTECSRRDFSARFAASVSVALAGGPVLAADVPEKPAAEPDSSVPEPALTFEDHQLAVLLERYPAAHLTPEMLEGVRRGLMSNRQVAERLRAMALPFDVEPAFVFRVWREE